MLILLLTGVIAVTGALIIGCALAMPGDQALITLVGCVMIVLAMITAIRSVVEE